MTQISWLSILSEKRGEIWFALTKKLFHVIWKKITQKKKNETISQNQSQSCRYKHNREMRVWAIKKKKK